MAAAAQPEKILKDLHQLWLDLAKEDTVKGSSILRACAMTLIAALGEDADPQQVGETLAQLMHEHPNRSIVLRAGSASQSDLEARVFAQCWRPVGSQRQICCEEVEITAPAAHFDDLPKLVLALTVPDLPVVLWCRAERLCYDAAFQQLFRLTDKIVIDSSNFTNPEAALTFMRDMAAQGHRVADLTWTRLTRLREAVAQIFENQQMAARLRKIESLQISYTGPEAADPSKMPLCLRYFSRWLRNGVGRTVETGMSRAGSASEPGNEGPCWEVRSVHFRGPEFEASVEIEESAATVRVGHLSRRSVFPRFTDYDLMREELSILGPDAAFQAVLAGS